ncbi:MAG: GntR family transcriptional regulator [Victivallales bacterium]|nr:GntR family transcriptional regulator [Victivallales bacterium]
MATSRKHQEVFGRLVDVLSDERLSVGDRVMPERDFARKLSVNMSTVRRAYRRLVLGGIVEKRVGSGTYLFQKPGAPWQERPVNLVLPAHPDSSGNQELERRFREVVAGLGRRLRVIHVEEEDVPELLASCQEFGLPTILGIDCEPELLMPHPEFFVQVSSEAYRRGIPCVLCDDTSVIGMLVAHFRGSGRRRTALLGGRPSRELQDRQQAIWREALGEDYAPELFIAADCTGVVGSFAEAAFAAVKASLPGCRFDSLIALTDEAMFGALAAIRQSGLDVPGDIAVASIGNTILARYSNPPVTSINPDIAGHIQAAVEMLDHNRIHPESLELLRLATPQLVVRESSTPKRNATP